MESFQEYFAQHPNTERKVAEKLGVTIQYIQQLKKGDSTPGLKLAIKIEDLYGIPARNWHRR
jgi:transcriptional regulator with XRE-family HTH domain